MRREPGRLTFPYDWLLDQVLDGRKTASVLRPGETNYGTDPRDDAVRVGGEYDACDTSGTPRCRIRVTEMRELRWGEPIPERLWRAEACASEEEFRRDHREWFSQPGPEYAFRAFWFERVAGVLLSIAAFVVLACVPAVAGAADAVGAVIASEQQQTAPVTGPTLGNAQEVVEAVMLPMLATGLVADGTVFAGLQLLHDGSVATADFHGGAYAANAQLAGFVRDATLRARFATTEGTLPRGWAIFWVLQPNLCRPWSYDAPPRATVIRVCLNVENGRVLSAGSYYVVDDLPPPARNTKEGVKLKMARIVVYPSAAIEKRAESPVVLRLTADETGRVLRVDRVEGTGDRDFERWLREWHSAVSLDLPPGRIRPGHTDTFDVRIAFSIARPGAKECLYALPARPRLMEDIRVCVTRGVRRG